MTKFICSKLIYLDGKLCNKPPSPNADGLTIVEGETEVAVITPYISLIVRELKKEEPDEVEKITSKETPTGTSARCKGSQHDLSRLSSQRLHQQGDRKWSEFMLLNKGHRKYNELLYEKTVARALSARRKWNYVQRKLAKASNKEIHIGSGPLWFQEPSDRQIALVPLLADILKADHEEGITSRTKQFLADLGIIPNVSVKDIVNGMEQSSLDPINFLLEMHAVVAKRQGKGLADKTFSINERILLSAVCTLHLPSLLLMLHIMLPLSNRNKKDTITTDCIDLEIQHCCPHLEPILCRGAAWFQQQVKRQIRRTLLVQKGIPLNSEEEMLETADASPFEADERFSELITDPLVVSYLDICADESIRRESCGSSAPEQPNIASAGRDSTNTYTFYVKRPGKIASVAVEEIEEEESIDEETDRNSPLVTHLVTSSSRVIKKEEEAESQVFVAEPVKVEIKVESYDLQHADNAAQLPLKEERLSTSVELLSIALDEESEDSPIQKLLDYVAELPKKRQLLYVLELLSAAGDPLAQLPDCQKLASVGRWLELRQGVRRKLTAKDNDELMAISRRMWTVPPLCDNIKIPKVKLSKREEQALTWDKRNWVRRKVDAEFSRYLSELKQQKVNSARSFYPTMLTQYYNKSKVNHNFRRCFYTYLPAREADIYVYRPWRLEENKQLGDD